MNVRIHGALIRNGQILMVQHVHEVRTYWTLPGGGVEPGETWEAAAIREVREETGLDTTVVRRLHGGPWPPGGAYQWEACFLVEMTEAGQEALLGYDPEDSHLEASARLLQAVSWFPLDQVSSDGQVSPVISTLKEPIEVK